MKKILFSTLMVGLMLFLFQSAHADSPAINLPQTGQTTCYDEAGALIPCAGTGQDGEFQKGVAWPSPRFTNPDGTTPISGSVVQDQLTGLMWTRDGREPGPVTCSPGFSMEWQEALDYVACLNTRNYLGYSDWRLPNRKEMRSLVNHEQGDQAAWLNAQGFMNVFTGNYWSSSSGAFSMGYAWLVYLLNGSTHFLPKIIIFSNPRCDVWPVRSGQSAPADLPQTGQTTCYSMGGVVISCTGTGQDGELMKGVAWPCPRFTNPDGTTPISGSIVADQLTGLMWTKDGNAPGPATCFPSSATTWQSALDYVACINTWNYLGYSDWRIPNINELESLANLEQSTLATWLNGQGFMNVQASFYWSSSTFAYGANDAWYVNLLDGDEHYHHKTNNMYVWPVRSGQVATLNIEPITGLTATPIAGSKIKLDWVKSPSTDAASYKIYSDNGTGAMNYATPVATVGVSTVTWTSGVLSTGVRYQYVIRTVSTNGCEENNTNIVSAVTFSTCPGAKASIKNPHTGKKFSGNRALIMAELDCGTAADVAQVLFQYKLASSGTWTDIVAANVNHLNPDNSSPYFVHWDVTGLANGDYNIRAVATDASSGADLEPSYITVMIDNANPDENEFVNADTKNQKDSLIQNGRANSIILGDNDADSLNEVTIPEGALAGTTDRVSIIIENEAEHDSKIPSNKDAIGEYRQVLLGSGQTVLNNEKLAEVCVSYRDDNNDEFIDGTGLWIQRARVNAWNGYTWEELAEPWVNTSRKSVCGKTSHFSLFGILGEPERTGRYGGGGGTGGGCFIATAAYGSYLHPHVQVLREFRDNVLTKFGIGKMFIAFYEKNSPVLAKIIEKRAVLKAISRAMLLPIIGIAWLVLNAPIGLGLALAGFGTVVLILRRRRK